MAFTHEVYTKILKLMIACTDRRYNFLSCETTTTYCAINHTAPDDNVLYSVCGKHRIA